MTKAIEYAKISAAEGEVPVGAVIARSGEIISYGRNRRESKKNALWHAEIEAIHKAAEVLGGWRLIGCDMYVTLEPCPMCAGAIINSRINKVIFGAYDKKAGSLVSVTELFELPYNHTPKFEGGFMEGECAAILSDFFKKLRNNI